GGLSSVFTSLGNDESRLEWGGPGGGLGTIYDSLRLNNVIVTTSNGSAAGSGNITIVGSSPDLTQASSTNTLLLVAHNNVNVNASIFSSGSNDLRIVAGWNEATTPASAMAANLFLPVSVIPNIGDINVNADISTRGNVLLQSGNNINV